MADEKRVSSGQGWTGENKLTRRQALAGAGATALSLGLAACGGSSSASTSTGAKTVSGTPRRGGSLRVAVEGNGLKDIMDAQNDLAKIDQARLVTGWEPLLEYDREFKLTTTGLAESVEPHGAMAYDIRVRQGIEFHNGKTLTADDVIYSMKRLTNKSLGLDGGSSVTSVDPNNLKKLDKYTVRVGLTQPDVTIPDGLGSFTCTIVPEGYTNKGHSWQDGQVGTGPFRLESFTPGQQSVHTRFENYWQSGKPYLDQVTIIDINDANARMNGLISGQVDAIADVPYSAGQADHRSAIADPVQRGRRLADSVHARGPEAVLRRPRAPGIPPDRRSPTDRRAGARRLWPRRK